MRRLKTACERAKRTLSSGSTASIELDSLIFQEIPNDKILVETDSPYLAPVPLRGKSNEPSFIIHTVKFLSQLKKLSFAEFSNMTTNNFFKLFGKLN